MHMANTLKTNSKLLFWVVLPILAFFLYSSYTDRQAKQKVLSFCNSIQINESLHSLLSKCAAAQAQCATWNPDNEVTRHQAWFSGFLLNSYTCEIRSKNDKIISKGSEDFTD